MANKGFGLGSLTKDIHIYIYIHILCTYTSGILVSTFFAGKGGATLAIFQIDIQIFIYNDLSSIINSYIIIYIYIYIHMYICRYVYISVSTYIYMYNIVVNLSLQKNCQVSFFSQKNNTWGGFQRSLIPDDGSMGRTVYLPRVNIPFILWIRHG